MSVDHDVFNGDADGLCALVQLRLVEPRDARLITGVKRDIRLLSRVPLAPHGRITALDINLDQNRSAVERLLEAGHDIFFADHHYPGDALPVHPRFTSLIDTSPTTCTSLIVDQHLGGRHAAWATVAAFGDNLNEVALARCQARGLDADTVLALRTLGVCLNYNAYGATLEDLHVSPEALYHAMKAHADPLDFMHQQSTLWQTLKQGHDDDMALGLSLLPHVETAQARIFLLPDAPWARRINGVLANTLANQSPDKAHALLHPVSSGELQVSIRAPLSVRKGADTLALQFPTGGGRQGAAGINLLPLAQLDHFISRMVMHWA